MTDQHHPAIAVDVEALMREIRSRIRGENREHDWVRQARRAVPSHLTSSVARLCAATNSLRNSVAAIGEPPPVPPTLRGKLGLVLLMFVRRSVFWLVPSIRTSQNLIIDTLEKHLKATEDILTVLHETNVEVARLREQLREASTTLTPAGGAPPTGRSIGQDLAEQSSGG